MSGQKLWAMGGLWAALAGGCATMGSSAVSHRRQDIRGRMQIRSAESKLAIAGPVHLMHVDYTGDDAIELLAVERRDGAAVCNGPVLARTRLHANRSNVLDVDVGSGEAICLAAPPQLRNQVTVSWHAVGDDRPRTVAER